MAPEGGRLHARHFDLQGEARKTFMKVSSFLHLDHWTFLRNGSRHLTATACFSCLLCSKLVVISTPPLKLFASILLLGIHSFRMFRVFSTESRERSLSFDDSWDQQTEDSKILECQTTVNIIDLQYGPRMFKKSIQKRFWSHNSIRLAHLGIRFYLVFPYFPDLSMTFRLARWILRRVYMRKIPRVNLVQYQEARTRTTGYGPHSAAPSCVFGVSLRLILCSAREKADEMILPGTRLRCIFLNGGVFCSLKIPKSTRPGLATTKTSA